MDNPVLGDFRERRATVSVGQELIQDLAPKIQAYSLHSGRFRGATWYHERADIVWLLAAAIHRSDDRRRDAYAHFAQLEAVGRLLPTREDIARVLELRTRSFARSLVEEVPALRMLALRQPDQIHSTVFAGRISLRIYVERGDPPFLYLAISQRLHAGDVSLPGEWLIQLLAAFFPSLTDIEELEVVSELPREVFPRPDEICFRYFTEEPK